MICLNFFFDDYLMFNFVDKVKLIFYVGFGGYGCILFLCEVYMVDGFFNGGDGGYGGSIYI